MKAHRLFSAGVGTFFAGLVILTVATLTGMQEWFRWFAALFQVGATLTLAGMILIVAHLLIVEKGVLRYVS